MSSDAPSTPPLTPPPARPAGQVRRRRRRRRMIILVAVILVLAGGGVFAAKSRQGEKPETVQVEKAEVRSLTQMVSATGRIEPETEVKISAEVAGEIIELPVKEGDPVKKGDLLVRINPEIPQRVMEAQEAAGLAAQAQLLQARAQLRQKELDFRDAERLYKEGVQAESTFRAAQAAFESAQAGVMAAEADVSRAEAGLRQARESLARTSIYSPMEGTISILNVELGDRVVATGQFAGTEIMRVADLGRMQARINVNENDIVDVAVGQGADVTVDAHRDVVLPGVVAEIANAARTAGAGSQQEVTNFEVRIRLVDPKVMLRPGMSCNADIRTKSATDVVAVPIQAVTVRTRGEDETMEELERKREEEARRNQGEGARAAESSLAERRREREVRESLRRVVFVRVGDVVKLREVETGISDLSHMEITSGVQAGEEVVSGPYVAVSRKLKDDMKVTVRDPAAEKKKKGEEEGGS